MKRMLFAAVLLALLVALAGCTSSENSGIKEGAAVPPSVSVYRSNQGAAQQDQGTDYQPSTGRDTYGNSVQVGATPIPIDPVDMPTPTPRPSLTFEYGAVSADRLGISFEAPQGWYVDMSDSSMVVLTDPNAYDGFNANMTIRIQNVSSDYNLSDVKEEVRAMLKEIGQYNFIDWSTSTLDDRTLMNRDGYYANYRGTYYDGTVVRGRVMVALLDGNRIITVHMAAPGWFNESYMNVVAHFRDTLRAL